MDFKFLKGIKRFFGDLSNFFEAGSVLGVDIGTSSIKIAEISQKGDRFSLSNYGILETRDYLRQSNLALQNSSLDIEQEEASRLLKLLINEMNPQSKTALVSIPSFASFVTLVDMPLLSKKEIRQSIQYQARQYIPMPMSEVSVDWYVVDRYKNQKGKDFQKILLVGMPNKIISRFKNICREADLKTVMMELDTIALVRAFSSFNTPTLVVDIGAQSSTISITEGHYVKFTSQTDYGGVHLTRSISQSLDLDMERADKLKQKRGLLGEGGQSELSTLIMPFLDVIIEEVNYVIGNYENRYGKEIRQFTLVGGGANLYGIEDYFSDQLDLQVVPSNSLVNIDYPTSVEPAAKKIKNEFPISIGLAKKYFTE